MRALRIRYQRIKPIASTGDRNTSATIDTTMKASPGSLCTKSLNDSYWRSSPKTPTRTPFPRFPGADPGMGALGSSSSSIVIPAPGLVVTDLLMVTDFFPLSTWMSRLAAPPSPSLTVAFNEGFFGSAGGETDRASWAWTPGGWGARAKARPRTTALPRTSRRTRPEVGAEAIGVAECINVSLTDRIACWMHRRALADSRSLGADHRAGAAGGACYYSLKRPPTAKIGRHMPIRAIFAAAGFPVRT